MDLQRADCMQENVQIFDFELTPEDMASFDKFNMSYRCVNVVRADFQAAAVARDIGTPRLPLQGRPAVGLPAWHGSQGAGQARAVLALSGETRPDRSLLPNSINTLACLAIWSSDSPSQSVSIQIRSSKIHR